MKHNNDELKRLIESFNKKKEKNPMLKYAERFNRRVTAQDLLDGV